MAERATGRRGFLLTAGAGAGALAVTGFGAPQAADATVRAPTVVHPPTGVAGTDMANIAAAIARTPPGGRVLLNSGEYVVDSLHLPSGTFLDLGGATIRQVHPTLESARGAAIRNSDFANGNAGIRIANGRIALGSGSRGRVTSFVNVRDLTLENLTIDKGTGDFADWMLYVRHCDDVRILGCRVVGGTLLGEDGIHIKESSRVVVDNCIVSSGDDAIAIVQEFGCTRASHDITISNCVIASQQAHMVRVSVYPRERFGIERLVISNVTGAAPVHAKGTPIQIDSATSGLIRNVVIENLDLDCTHAPGTGMTLKNVQDVTVRGARLAGVANSVFVTEACTRVTFSDCHASQRAGVRDDAWVIADSSDVVLDQCSAMNATNASFRVTGRRAARISFTGCRSMKPRSHSFVLAHVAGVTLVGCTVNGGVAGVWCDTASPPSDVKMLGCTVVGITDRPVRNAPPSTTLLGNTGGSDLRPGGTVLTGPLGFFGKSPVGKPSGVPVTVAGIHAALIHLGLIAS